MSAPVQLIQFAKWPEAGWVKTRLEPLLGREGALEAHIRLTLTVLNNLAATAYPVDFFWDRSLTEPPAEAAPVLAALEAKAVPQRVQCGVDLGARMTSALAEGLARADTAMIVGSDCPSVDAGYIGQAKEALVEADLVFGPSDDGGYVLIGARTTSAEMLAGVAWGTADALEQSMAAARKEGLKVATLSPRWDVDEPEDWARFTDSFG